MCLKPPYKVKTNDKTKVYTVHKEKKQFIKNLNLDMNQYIAYSIRQNISFASALLAAF